MAPHHWFWLHLESSVFLASRRTYLARFQAETQCARNSWVERHSNRLQSCPMLHPSSFTCSLLANLLLSVHSMSKTYFVFFFFQTKLPSRSSIAPSVPSGDFTCSSNVNPSHQVVLLTYECCKWSRLLSFSDLSFSLVSSMVMTELVLSHCVHCCQVVFSRTTFRDLIPALTTCRQTNHSAVHHTAGVETIVLICSCWWDEQNLICCQ